MFNKPLHIKLKIEQHKRHFRPDINLGAPETYALPAQLVASDALLLLKILFCGRGNNGMYIPLFDESIDVVSKIDIASAQFYRPVGFHSFYFTALRAPVVHSWLTRQIKRIGSTLFKWEKWPMCPKYVIWLVDVFFNRQSEFQLCSSSHRNKGYRR